MEKISPIASDYAKQMQFFAQKEKGHEDLMVRINITSKSLNNIHNKTRTVSTNEVLILITP